MDRLNHKRLRKTLAILAGLVSLIFVGSCSGEDELSTSEQLAAETAAQQEINLAVGPSTAAEINAAIAQRLIEQRLGNPVSTSAYNSRSEMLRQLGDGQMDANLEVWPSTLTPKESELIEELSLDRLGELGSVGKIGWYVPRYVIDSDPKLETWQGYKSSTVATQFATEETEGKGRLLGIEPFYETVDEELIEELGLPFEVVYSGSEENTIAELERAAESQDPILLYWWSPRAEVAEFDLVNVKLPNRTEECIKKSERVGGFGCDYPEDRLIKLGSSSLKDRAPKVRSFLSNFKLDTQTQIDLLQQAKSEDLTAEAVAADWISENPSIWQPWFAQAEEETES